MENQNLYLEILWRNKKCRVKLIHMKEDFFWKGEISLTLKKIVIFIFCVIYLSFQFYFVLLGISIVFKQWLQKFSQQKSSNLTKQTMLRLGKFLIKATQLFRSGPLSSRLLRLWVINKEKNGKKTMTWNYIRHNHTLAMMCKFIQSWRVTHNAT